MSNTNYKVYCHINKLNGKKYVGITKTSLQKRWRDGKGYKGSTKFYFAIQKYGWDNFDHEVLYENLTEKQAKEKEIELIKKWNTKENGYNTSSGGDEIYDHSLPIIQYDLEGNFIKLWNSASQVSDELGYQKSTIRRCVLGQFKTAYGFIWKAQYDELVLEDHFFPKHINKVDMYDKQGNLLNTYDNPTDASDENGIAINHICSCCRGEIHTYKGYIWRWHNEPFDKYPTRRIESDALFKPVDQYDYDGNLLATYESIKNASEITDVDKHGISNVCKGKNVTSGGYIWRFKGEDFNKYNITPPKNSSKKKKHVSRCVEQYTLDDTFVQTFSSIAVANKYLGKKQTHIADVCEGKRNNCCGYIWKYAS